MAGLMCVRQPGVSSGELHTVALAWASLASQPAPPCLVQAAHTRVEGGADP